MAISAADVKKLRDTTGAGMMDAKKALEETAGDFDKAVEVLRVKGAAKAAKRGAEREATSGLVVNSGSALVELKSETDFVARTTISLLLLSRLLMLLRLARPSTPRHSRPRLLATRP